MPGDAPERVSALARPTIDQPEPEFAALTAKVLVQLKRVFQTGPPASFPRRHRRVGARPA